jgi:DNA replication protein DnaC
LLDTLPERFALARSQKMPHQDFLLLALGDEVSRRDSLSATVRADKAGLDVDSVLERWDPSANVTLDQALLNELVSLRFVEARTHVAIVGPVGVGKTFLAHALGHLACRRGHSVVAVRADKMLKGLRHARLDNSYDAELRRLIPAADRRDGRTRSDDAVAEPTGRPRKPRQEHRIGEGPVEDRNRR